jgi:hypothetical protein
MQELKTKIFYDRSNQVQFGQSKNPAGSETSGKTKERSQEKDEIWPVNPRHSSPTERSQGAHAVPGARTARTGAGQEPKPRIKELKSLRSIEAKRKLRDTNKI